MHQLFGAIGAACGLLLWILLLSGDGVAGENVEHISSPPASYLKSVPQSRADMALNAAPFQMSPFKNPLFLRSLINSASNKLVHGAYASKRFDMPSYLTPPGAPFLPPGMQLGSPSGQLAPPSFIGGPLAGPGLQYFQQQQLPQLPPGGHLVPQAHQQVAQPGQRLTQKEFQQYMKAAVASKNGGGDEYLTQDEFQKYLKRATNQKKKQKGNNPALTPEEFQEYVLQAQDARQQELLKSGKPFKPGNLKTLTPEDFKKFFDKEKAGNRPSGSGAPSKKYKRGHYSSAGSFSSSGSFSDGYPPPPSPPKYLPSHPPKFEPDSGPHADVYPDVYPAHQIETEDQATKRSVLDALWRAFQAITGGALTIGGHIARGGGALLEAKGKLIASAGPVVSDFGRTVAAKAVAPTYSHSHVTPYDNYRDFVEESHSPQSSLLQTAYDVASSLKVAALGTTKAVADLISELSSASAKAYLLKD